MRNKSACLKAALDIFLDTTDASFIFSTSSQIFESMAAKFIGSGNVISWEFLFLISFTWMLMNLILMTWSSVLRRQIPIIFKYIKLKVTM